MTTTAAALDRLEGLVELEPVAQQHITGGGGLVKLAWDAARELINDFIDNYECFVRGFRAAYRG